MGAALITELGTNALVRVYSGAVPANVAASLGAAVQLGELACSSTFALAPSGGVITANAITQDSAADATGTASFFRVLTSGGTPKWQGTCGGTAQSTVGDLQLNSTAIVVGGPIAVTALALTMPGA